MESTLIRSLCKKQQMRIDKQFRVLLLDMWLHEKDASELVHFLYKKPHLLGSTPRITPFHKGDSNFMVRAVGDLEDSESESEGDEVCAPRISQLLHVSDYFFSHF